MSRQLEHGDYDRCYLSDSIQALPRERELRRHPWYERVLEFIAGAVILGTVVAWWMGI